MNNPPESKIINLCVANKDKSGLHNSPAYIVGMACISRLDPDHFSQLQLKRQFVSPTFNKRFSR
jgi:hypothetical protein